MDPLRIIVLVLHISSAALLVGAPVGLSRNLKLSLELGGKAFVNAAEDAVRRGRLIGISSLVTLGTGLTLIFMAGGMGAVPLNFHMALGVMIVAILLGAGFLRPTGAKLLALSKKEPLDQDAVRTNIKRIAMGTGIQHLLWVITLTLMFVRIYK